MNQTKSTSKKLLALLLALIMTVSLLPMSVFAAELGTAEEEVIVPATGEEETEDAELEEDGVDTYAAEDIALQAATEINYVKKEGEGKSLKDDKNFYRIVHIDCGRKYFSVDDLKKIIDYAAEYNYTHVELAFGNDGLRFLLDDMEVTASGVIYASEKVKSAIQAGNRAFYDAKTNELTQEEMNTLIFYAKSKGIGIIPMFDAPGHLQAVVCAMEDLGLNPQYTKPTTSGTSKNYAIDPTDAATVNFVQALMQKYITYFASEGCTMFNIAADECGFSSMNAEEYTAYAKMVNSMAAMVQNAGMTALAFNDGIYHIGLTTSVDFDTNIAVCYWDASSDKYASAATLAGKGFKIINTNNKWYYVIGKENITGSGWSNYAYTCQYAKQQMSNENSCLDIDGDNRATKPAGCMAAIWCDYPGNSANWDNVNSYIATLAQYNPDYFKAPETPKEPELTANMDTVAVGGTVTFTLENYTGEADGIEWSSSATGVLELSDVIRANNSITAKALKEGNATVTATVEDKAYTKSVTVTAQQLTEKTITVTVGKTSEPEFIEAIQYATGMSYTTKNPSIATVAVSDGSQAGGSTFTAASSISNNGGYYIKNSSDKYLTLSGTWVDSIDNATEWTATSYNSGYRLSNGSYYLRYRNNNWTTTTNNAATLYFNNGTLYRTRQWSGGGYTYSNPLGTPGTKATGTPREGINVTFTGVAVGTTYVTIGNVKYTINVVPEDLAGVSPLPIQLWITNNIIRFNEATTTTGQFGNSNYRNAYYLSINATATNGTERVNSEDGMALSQLIPDSRENMKEYDNVYFDPASQTSSVTGDWSEREGKELVLFQGVLHKDEVQYKLNKDYSNTGTVFQYVRYLGGKWSVSADRIKWVDVDTSLSKTTGSSTSNGTQIVAYYMMRSEITTEVTTDVADWGYVNTDAAYNTQIKKGQYVMLDFAVKYEGGTRNPDSFPQDGKTFVFHCTQDDSSGSVKTDSSGNYYRQLNNFRGVNTGDYEIYMVTVTMTEDGAGNTLENTTSYTYNGEEQIVWAIDEATRDNCGLKEYKAITSSDTVYSGCKVGGDPYVRGVEVYNQHGALITYYIRLKTVSEDSLKVHYINQKTDEEFYNYLISVKQGVIFDSTFGQVKRNSTQLIGNTVENYLGFTETVIADLKEIAKIGAQYKYSTYTCVDTHRSGDGKEVFLYYTFDATKTFVVDFGLPLTIKPSDINKRLGNARIERMAVKYTSKYADIQTNLTDYSFTYKLTATIDGQDEVTATYFGTNPGTNEADNASYTITIIPASNVYYEDSFVTFSTQNADKKILGWTRVDDEGNTLEDVTAAEKNATQALEELGSKKNVYGYDPAYDSCTMFSMGSAMKTTVSGDNYATAEFTFMGTGFDVISMASNTSGTIVVTVTDGEDYEKNYVVDTYYGYRYDEATETWIVSENDPNTLYQIPVMKVTVPYGTYTATVTAAYNKVFDHKDNSTSYDFYLDAIRVYNPLGEDYADYTKDQEGYPQYIKLRNELAKENDTVKPNDELLFIDGKENAEVALYRNYGPNNEVYLMNGQAITFKLTGLANVDKIQIGAKSPMGDKSAVMMVNNNKVGPKDGEEISDITTATEMYYDITEIVSSAEDGQLTITNLGGAGILSLTNLKITFKSDPGNTKVALGILTDTEQANAVQMVRALFAAPVEPDPEPVVFVPERFEASWNRSTVKVGQKATLTVKTSEDVDAITVDGVTIDTYRTRTERTGWGWNAKRVTYREFTYTITAKEAGTLNCSIAAFNAENTASEPITAALTVQAAAQRPSWGGWLGSLFGRWF